MNRNSATFPTLVLSVLFGTLLLGGCERPPVDSEQVGFRGTGMVQIENPRLALEHTPPEPQPAMSADGPKAGAIYSNVQVLGDLSIGQFTRLMTAMTSWVSPEQGCNYCHIPTDLASDDIYTKVVSRRMLEMTRYLNSEHQSHVGDTGVTCYTCHRGKNVPEIIWTDDPSSPNALGAAGWRDTQNVAGESVPAYSSLPYEPFQRYLTSADNVSSNNIRVISETALPLRNNRNRMNIKDTEWTYSLMMHMSDGLGVNCTYCHNSRAFASWEESNPVRTTAWHGLSMVADMNEQFLIPLASELPPERLGPHGDAPKANCGTCHQGLPKPLGGAPMLADYPNLRE